MPLDQGGERAELSPRICSRTDQVAEEAPGLPETLPTPFCPFVGLGRDCSPLRAEPATL